MCVGGGGSVSLIETVITSRIEFQRIFILSKNYDSDNFFYLKKNVVLFPSTKAYFTTALLKNQFGVIYSYKMDLGRFHTTEHTTLVSAFFFYSYLCTFRRFLNFFVVALKHSTVVSSISNCIDFTNQIACGDFSATVVFLHCTVYFIIANLLLNRNNFETFLN